MEYSQIIPTPQQDYLHPLFHITMTFYFIFKKAVLTVYQPLRLALTERPTRQLPSEIYIQRTLDTSLSSGPEEVCLYPIYSYIQLYGD